MERIQENRKRSLFDKLICYKNQVKYRLVEPATLKLSRLSWNAKDGGKISILLPTRNRWEMVFKRSVPSILNQTYQNWELIIIDDGGDIKQSRKAANLLEQYDERIKVLHVHKYSHYPDRPFFHWLVGPSNALNRGLSHASGDWIARLDDDDDWAPRHLETMLRFAEDVNAEFVSGLALDVVKGKLIQPYQESVGPVGSVQTWLYRSYLKCFKYNLDSWRKSWDKNNEIDLYKRMIKAGVRMKFLDYCGAYIDARPGVSQIGLAGYLEEHDVSR
jgi:glycosyltransferase involved in cell wall biosynthesis